MVCPNCQSENKEGAKFCNDCGFPLTGRIATVAAAAASASHAEGAEDATSTAQNSDTPVLVSLAAGESLRVDASVVPEIAGEELPDEERESVEDVAPAPSVRQGSGPLLSSSIPDIGVAGVNRDDEGNEFDFSELSDDKDIEQPPLSEQEEPTSVSSAAVTADLSGLDECLVDASYAPPQAAWRSGDTMEMPRIDGAAAPQQKEFKAPDPNSKKRGPGKVVAIVLALLVIATVAAAGVTYQMELWGGKVLPNVAGLTQADATYQLEGKGFSVRATQVKSDEAEGLVLLMDPREGSRAEKGSEVVIQVAVPRVVPDVVGKTQAEAVKLFEEQGFMQVSFVEEKSNEAEGMVLSMTPEPGSKGRSTTPISVKVSIPFTVPDVVGKPYDEATKLLEESSYVANVLYYYTETVTEGLVVSTDPVAGEKRDSGSSITLNVAKSRKSVLEAAALAYLQSVGTLQIGGTSYVINSVDAVSYTGNNQTSFTVTGQAATTLDGETVYGSKKQKTGVIVWDDNNNIVSIS